MLNFYFFEYPIYGSRRSEFIINVIITYVTTFIRLIILVTTVSFLPWPPNLTQATIEYYYFLNLPIKFLSLLMMSFLTFRR